MGKMISPSPGSVDILTVAPRIIHHALAAVAPDSLIGDQLCLKGDTLIIKEQAFDLERGENIHAIGAGKGAAGLYKSLDKLLGRRISGGVIVSSSAQAFFDARVRFMPAAHPLPDETSLEAGLSVKDYVNRNVKPGDLVFVLITGGASAQLVLPAGGITLEDKIAVNRELLRCGADINEINCVRKHLSALKGGRLAELIGPAVVITLIISDIIGSPLENIGSGPSVGDSTTFVDARRILHKYGLILRLPPTVKTHIERGIKGEIPETPSPDSLMFSRNHHFVLGDNQRLLASAADEAEKFGIIPHILTGSDSGEASAYAEKIAVLVKECASAGKPCRAPVLLLSGGELTVTVKGRGRGGRNQEFVLHMLRELRDFPHPYYIASVGTDGIDGSSDAAGAWIDHHTLPKAAKQHLDIDAYLENNDSHHFFQKLDQLIKTGPTGTNVMDLRLVYIGKKANR